MHVGTHELLGAKRVNSVVGRRPACACMKHFFSAQNGCVYVAVCCHSHTGDLFKMKKKRTVNSLGGNIAEPVLHKAVIALFLQTPALLCSLFSAPGLRFSVLAKLTCQ